MSRLNAINGDINMWEEQDENGDDDEVPIVQRGSASNSHGSSSLSIPPTSDEPIHTSDDSIFEGHDENSLPKITRQAPPVDLPTKTRLQIKVKKLHVVAEWKWVQGGDDQCGICRMPFEACCVDCTIPGDGCPLVLGACKHPFHMHCIVKWTESQSSSKPQCPLCRQEWKFS